MNDVGRAHDHREAKRNQTVHAADREPADHEVDELGNAESTHCAPLAWKDRGLTRRCETARTARLVYPTVGCEWVRPELTAGSAVAIGHPPFRGRGRGRLGRVPARPPRGGNPRRGLGNAYPP